MAVVEMDAQTRNSGNRGRKADKETRRQQLIEATIDSLAKRGFAETTMADVSDGAGLSRGIVNFYFESKEKLLVSTLQFLSDHYSAHWRAALDKAGERAADRLFALVACDFDRKVCNKRNLAAWCAFWGEAKSRPTYQALCGARDEAYQKLFVDLCSELIEEGGYPHHAEHAAVALLAMLEGLWHRLMMGGENIAVEGAKRVAQHQLVISFPKHYRVVDEAGTVKVAR